MFDDFYKMYPRKVAKKHAQKMWARLTHQQQQAALEALPKHIKLWNAEGRDTTYIPHPGSWLGGERFDDEVSMPDRSVVAWWQSDEFTMAYGRKLGIPARPGEDMAGYRERLKKSA